MNTPFTLDHLKHFEAELKSPAPVRLLQMLAMRCAQMQENSQIPDGQVSIKLDLLGTAYALDLYHVKPLLTVVLFGTPITASTSVKERDAKLRVWNCIRRGEKFVQFNTEGEQGGRYAMVWFWLGSLVSGERVKPENFIDVTVGIHSDFVDAMVEYGRALMEAEESEESGATA